MRFQKMDRKIRFVIAAALLVGLLLLVTVQVYSANNPEIRWYVFGGGGGGGGCSTGQTCLQGTFGQPIAGYASNGSVSVGSGFWYGISRELRVYLPFIRR